MNQSSRGKLETEDFLANSWLNGRIQCKYPDPNSSNAELIGYHENGRVWFRYPIVNCLKQGVCKIWDENGQLQIEEIFEKDRLHGLRREWYPNGNIKAETRYRNGQANGAYKTWYENGRLLSQGFYVDGVLNGIVRYWYPSGVLKIQESYDHGTRQGMYVKWSEDGKIVVKKIYIRGVAVSGRVHEWINSSKLTASRILGIRNTAVRRICIEEMGYERFLAQVKHTVISREVDYEFLKIDRYKIEEPICLIRVKCPSTGVFYVLRVPPTVKTIKEAIAWTFGLKETEYNPQIET